MFIPDFFKSKHNLKLGEWGFDTFIVKEDDSIYFTWWEI